MSELADKVHVNKVFLPVDTGCYRDISLLDMGLCIDTLDIRLHLGQTRTGKACDT
jgi:hypothetical protein